MRHYLYLWINIIGLAIVGIGYAVAGKHRRGMLLSGLALVPASALSMFHEQAYWTPVRLNGGVWGIEDVLFCFSVGSLAWLFGIWPLRRNIQFPMSTRSALRRLAIVSLICVILTAVFRIFLPIMPATIAAQTVLLCGILLLRAELCTSAWWAGCGYGVYYLAVLYVFNSVYPDFFRLWSGQSFLSMRPGGLPIEELVWVVSAAACWVAMMGWAVNLRLSGDVSGEKSS